DRPLILDLPFARVGITICYDLMFPEYIRGLVLQGANLIVNSTHWQSSPDRLAGWGRTGEVTSRLAGTRALENGVHVAMAARTGQTPDRVSLGFSCIAAPSGKMLNR